MRSKRGMTLAEICVTLAVISVMTAGIVSFVISVSRETDNGVRHLDAVKEIKLVEAVVEQEIEFKGFITEGEYPSRDGVLEIGGRALNLSAITGVAVKNADTEEPFYVCTITYELNGTRTYTFCVDPLVGDVVYEEDSNENQ